MPAQSESITIPSRIAECADDGHIIHGVAIRADEVTRGMNGRKRWPAETLRESAASLEGVPVNVLHSEQTVGEVTRAAWSESEQAVLYEAQISDSRIASQIKKGHLEPSIESRHGDGGADDTGAMLVVNNQFSQLSIVQHGASPGGSADAGPAPQQAFAARLSASAIQAALADSGDDVDQDELAKELEGPIGSDLIFLNPNLAVGKANEMGLDGEIHEMDVDGVTIWLPGGTHDELLDALDSGETAEAASQVVTDAKTLADGTLDVGVGDIVTWDAGSDRTAAGRVLETIDEGRYDTELAGDAVVNAPAALIRLYRPPESDSEGGESGGTRLNAPEWRPTQTTVAHRLDTGALDVVRGWPSEATAALSDAGPPVAEDWTADDATESASESESASGSDDASEAEALDATADSDTDAERSTAAEQPEQKSMSEDNPDPDPDDDVQALKARLSDKTERVEALEARIDDLEDENEQLEAKASAVDEAEDAYAEALAAHVPRDAEALKADLSLPTMQEWLGEIEEAALAQVDTPDDPEPDVQSGATPSDDGTTETAELSSAQRDEKRELEAELSKWEDRDSVYAQKMSEHLQGEIDALGGDN